MKLTMRCTPANSMRGVMSTSTIADATPRAASLIKILRPPNEAPTRQGRCFAKPLRSRKVPRSCPARAMALSHGRNRTHACAQTTHLAIIATSVRGAWVPVAVTWNAHGWREHGTTLVRLLLA